MRIVRGLNEGIQALSRPDVLGEVGFPDFVNAETARLFGERLSPRQAVERILADVRQRGDEAVRRYSRLLDGWEADELELPPERMKRALSAIPDSLRTALERAATRVRNFHEACLPKSWMDSAQGLGEQFNALERAGIYIPGGRNVYPSTVIMTAIPARVAGVSEIILTTPARDTDGEPSKVVLAAAALAGVDRVFQVGGAQAIAALAYGTESIPKVDTVCGPGNLFVTIAKQMVYGQVGVDGLYGPTETVVVADSTSNPVFCAADLLAQAEHDALASPILVTTSESLVARVEQELGRQITQLRRQDIASQSLEANGLAIIVGDMEEAIELTNRYAPEHLCLLVDEPWQYLSKIRNAGAVFVGQDSPEVLGDYTAGPSHVMPTAGTARFNSPLGVHQFLKVTSVVGVDLKTLNELAGPTIQLAEAEEFDAHARAVQLRLGIRGPRREAD